MSGSDYLYHYTDEQGYKGISKDKKIRESTDTVRDAAFRKGTYFTGKPPTTNTDKLKTNNFDGIHMPDKRVEYAIGIKKSDLPGIEKADAGARDVHVVPGDVDLTKTPHKVYKRNVQK